MEKRYPNNILINFFLEFFSQTEPHTVCFMQVMKKESNILIRYQTKQRNMFLILYQDS